MDSYYPELEQNVPLPISAREALPELSMREELDMRANTIKLLADLTGSPIDPGEDDRTAATALAGDLIKNGPIRPDMAIYPNETIAYLAGLVSQYDTLVVQELADLKRYVVNRLIEETNHPDGKVRLTALKSLGEVDGVDAFKKRTEITIKQQSIEEVEAELLATIAKLEQRTVDVPMVEVVTQSHLPVETEDEVDELSS
jgi:HEAT repeat protein